MGSGLVEMDKATKSCRTWNTQDGLLLPRITALARDKSKLWIGFGRQDVGGVGYLDLNTRKFIGITRALDVTSVSNRSRFTWAMTNEAPRGRIVGLNPEANGDLWLLSEDIGLRHYSAATHQWRTLDERRLQNGYLSSWECLAASSNYVAVGGFGGVVVHSPSDGGLNSVRFGDWLRRNTTGAGSILTYPFAVNKLAADGERVWVGGRGFIALADLKSQQIERLCNFDESLSQDVRGLQFDGQNLWVAIDNKLYRIAKADER